MIVDMEATLAKVRSETKRLEDETDSQYEARTLHLALLLLEHRPEDAVFIEKVEETK